MFSVGHAVNFSVHDVPHLVELEKRVVKMTVLQTAVVGVRKQRDIQFFKHYAPPNKRIILHFSAFVHSSQEIKKILLGKARQIAEGIHEKGRNLRVLQARLEITVVNLFHPGVHWEHVETIKSEKHYAVGYFCSYAF